MVLFINPANHAPGVKNVPALGVISSHIQWEKHKKKSSSPKPQASECVTKEVIALELHHKNMYVKSIPLIPNFYIEKLGFTGVFLSLIQNIDCGAVLTSTHNQCFELK